MCAAGAHSLHGRRPRRYLACCARAGSPIKLNELTSFFMICTGRIKPEVLLVGICINKLRERGSSVGRELSMCYTARECLVRSVSAWRSGCAVLIDH